MQLPGLKYKENHPVFIIAEMSGNHLQNIDRAKQIIKAAKDSGADAIKLQTYTPDTITLNCRGKEFEATPGSPWEGKNLYELYSEAYTPWDWHKELFDYAAEVGITCFSTPFDLSAVDFLEKLGVSAYKIASFEINDLQLIEKAAMTGKPIILSTGIAQLTDIVLAVETCMNVGNNNITLLKCISEYPAPFEDMNLLTMCNMEETFGCRVGISDHSLGDEIAVAATTLGASVIEKHLTLKRSEGGPDASFSMEPVEFSNMVRKVRNVEQALGKVNYRLTEKQKKSRERSRSLYISMDVKKGDILTPYNLKSVRPGYGLHTKYYKELLGKSVTKDLPMGTAMRWEYIK